MIAVKKEEQYLNILRVIAINLVILLHCISPYVSNSTLFGTKTWWICDILSGVARMGVPTFFAISGYLLLCDSRTLNIKEFYKHRMSKILIPFIVWDIAYFLAGRISTGQSIDIKVFFSELLVQGSQYHLWYVYSITGLYLLAPFLKRITDACTPKQAACFIVVIMLPVTIFRFINIMAPVYVYIFSTLVEGYAGYFVMGYLLGKYPLSKKSRYIIYCCGILSFVGGALGNYLKSSPSQMNMFFNEGYSITHYMTTAALFVFIKNIKPLKSHKADTVMSTYSKLTYGIYLSHVMILSAFNHFAFNHSPAFIFSVGFIVTTITSTAFVYVISKTRHLRKLLM